MQIYVLGDFGSDHYHIGKVRGISAEVPVPVLDLVQESVRPAMAGNVAANLTSLGAEMVIPVRIPDPTTWPVKNRLMTEAGQQLARWDVDDECLPYTRGDLVPLMHADAVVVADYGKGAISREIAEILAQVSRSVPTFVDTKQSPEVWLGSDAILFPNLVEYKQFSDVYNLLPRVVLKQGALGLAYLEYGRAILSRPSLARYAQCVNGAGDTVLAAFTVAHLAGASLNDSLDWASAAAGCVVEQHFLQRTVSVEQVLTRVEEHEQENERNYIEVPPFHSATPGIAGCTISLPLPTAPTSLSARPGNDGGCTSTPCSNEPRIGTVGSTYRFRLHNVDDTSVN